MPFARIASIPTRPDLSTGNGWKRCSRGGRNVIVGSRRPIEPGERVPRSCVDAAAILAGHHGSEVRGQSSEVRDQSSETRTDLRPLTSDLRPLAAADIGFVLFGDGPLRGALESQIVARGLQGRFHIAGHHSDLDKYYPHLDLLALPSYTEGLPNVVLEAFAAGVPVVATAVGGTPEAVLHGINGYLVEAGDSRALAGRIADMLADPARRREMAANGQRYVRQEFSFAGQARDYRQLIESLI